MGGRGAGGGGGGGGGGRWSYCLVALVVSGDFPDGFVVVYNVVICSMI